MYNEQIEKLIEMALLDGELTEKEREILIRKATESGIDRDEFEMVLEARLYERQKENTSSQPLEPSAPKSEKFGEIRKCPACGSIVGAVQAVCGDCGHNFTNISAVSSVTKLHEQLLAIESEERNRQKAPVEKGGFFQRITNPAAHISAMKEATQDVNETILTRKAGVIQSFPVPNSREDMLEFLTMAVPECKKKPNWLMMQTGTGKLYKAWHSKAEQIIMKAKFSLKEDKKAMEEILYYANELNIKI